MDSGEKAETLLYSISSYHIITNIPEKQGKSTEFDIAEFVSDRYVSHAKIRTSVKKSLP